nr:iron chelate uptake ABC transporter family permease subunit [Pectobacterium colocasium]
MSGGYRRETAKHRFLAVGQFCHRTLELAGRNGGAASSLGGLLLRLRWHINILSMGEQDARALGIAVQPLRWLILSLCAAIVAAQVAVSGSIGWIGLVIPHVARRLVGADHRRLLPVSLWLGEALWCWLTIWRVRSVKPRFR